MPVPLLGDDFLCKQVVSTGLNHGDVRKLSIPFRIPVNQASRIEMLTLLPRYFPHSGGASTWRGGLKDYAGMMGQEAGIRSARIRMSCTP